MRVQPFFDPTTSTLTYVIHDPATRDAVVLDPVLDFDPAGAQTSTASLDAVLAFVRAASLRVHFILETHAHADHLSGAQLLKRELDARLAIGRRITEVQETFKQIFDLPQLASDGSQFDRLLDDGELVRAGSLEIEAIATAGHTPACMTYRLGDAIFTGDALFVEDQGVGRCDFPRGSAAALYRSVHERLYALPEATRVFVGHDYRPNGRPLRFETTIEASKRANVHLKADTTEAEFVRLRNARDATLAPPRLLFPSVQINVDAGRLPPPRADGIRRLSVPLNLFARTDEAGRRR